MEREFLTCCNAFGDKEKIQALVSELAKLVEEAYSEGYVEGYGSPEPFDYSESKKQLDKILKEVV